MSETDRMINELKLAGLYDADSDYDGMIGEAVEELLLVFQKQGHSGFSAPHVASIFQRLVSGETLTPLTGEDEEWGETFGGGILQNKRCSYIFKEIDGGAYNIDGRIFVDKDGCSFTNFRSRTEVVFPYSEPKAEVIKEGTPEAEQYSDVFS